MGCVAVKFNFLTHSMAQGKKQKPLTSDGIPTPSTNIQEAVIQGYTVKGKDVVRRDIAPRALITQDSWFLFSVSRDVTKRFSLMPH